MKIKDLIKENTCDFQIREFQFEAVIYGERLQ